MKKVRNVLTSLSEAIVQSCKRALLILAILFLSAPSLAQEQGSEEVLAQSLSIKAEGYNRDGYGRIILRTGKTRNFNVSRAGDNLFISFDSPIEVDFGNVAETLADFIESSNLNNDKKTLSFKLKQAGYKIRKFIGDGLVGVDIMTDQMEKITAGSPISILPEQRLRAMSRFTEAREMPKITPHLKPLLSLQKITKHPPLITAKPSQAQEIKIAETKKEEAATEKKAEVKTETKPEKQTYDRVSLEVGYEKAGEGSKLIFPWEENVGAAIFTRGDFLWVVFDKPAELKLRKIKGLKYIDDINQISYRTHTVLQIKISPDYQVQKKFATKNNFIVFRGFREKNNWILEIQQDDISDPDSGLVANTVGISSAKDKNGPKVILSADSLASPLELTDTEVGDSLIVVPLVSSETGIRIIRKYVDFWLPDTIQGIVIQKISDVLTYEKKENEIEISKTGRLNLSPSLIGEEIEEETSGNTARKERPVRKTVLPSETAFPFKFSIEKEGEEKKGFSDIKQQLFAELLVLPEKEKTGQRLKMAKFFFANSLYSDAIGMLEEMKRTDPYYDGMQEVDIIEAASEYMLGRYKEAEEKFKQVAGELNEDHENYDEIRTWLWASHFRANRGDRKKNDEFIPVDYIASYDKFMQHYPADVRYQFGLLAAEELLDEGNTDSANTIIEIISYKSMPENLENSTIYLRGRSAEIEGNIDEAMKIWQELADDVNDRFNRARAIYDITRLKLLHGRISIKEALETFESLSPVWRGDSFELDLLKLVGQLYIKEGDYFRGLKKWHTLVTSFPNTREALFIAGRMKKTFIQLFDEGEAYKLPPLNALALYFEFRELTPVGKRGDKIIKQLADHFIKADLLDSAIALITHQVNFRSSGEERNELTIKLVELYIKNRQPEQALGALDLIDQDAATDEITKTAKYLRGKILIRLGRFEDTFALLKDDFSENAQNLRLDIMWRQKNWFGIITIAETRVEEAKNQRQDISLQQQRDIIRLAVSYASQEYREKLRELRDDFLSRLPEKSVVSVFDFITNDIESLDFEKFEETVQLAEIEAFLDEYAFWPAKDWRNVAVVLKTKVGNLKDKKELSIDEQKEVLRLAIAYAMQIKESENENKKKEATKEMSALQRDFRNIVITRDNIDVFEILDDKFVKKSKDVAFEGKVPMSNITSFIEMYIPAQKMSELNAVLK